MKNFFKYLLATILGVFITGLLMFFIFFGIAGAIMSKSDKAVEVKENSLLVVKFDNEIVDRGSKSPFDDFNFASMKPSQKLGLNDILKAIKNAADDPKILGIYMENQNIPAGAATVEEIRDALLKFKESGKFIYSFSNVYSQKSYYLSTVSDKIMLNPEGGMMWSGLSSEITFFKNALEKLGVEAQIIRHGKFKAAVEPFMYEKMSDDNREQIMTYTGSIWNHWVKGISEARGISPEQLNLLADNMDIRNAKTALENGLVDSLVYKDQVVNKLKELTNTEEKDDITSISIAQYAKVPAPRKEKGLAKEKIAVIYATGNIVDGDNSDGNIAGDHYGRVIREARRDSSIKAIILRVNSGGGSALASEIMWREMTLAKEVKPVIVSMGDVAASGGYYIAAPADVILASPTTITGSIGVFGMYPSIKEGMNKKLGVNVDVVKTNKHSDFGTIFRPLTAEERAVAQLGVEEIYQTFIGHVALGRSLTVEQVDEIGQGRVWSGVNAMDIKLIDEFGGLERAIEIAAEKANLENYRITELPKQKDPFEALLKDLTGSAKASLLEDELGFAYKHYKNLMELANTRGVQARIPYEIEVY
ncbi:MAG TPA: signal peptide peptidase SppA [Tenuifilaceae bacterium]|nr:signal peptide peptidase SppA [Tenuifilaceae bacterium]HPQ34678.1 signal peptide peptidase SppA [Tenuifilaceae bacterium]